MDSKSFNPTLTRPIPVCHSARRARSEDLKSERHSNLTAQQDSRTFMSIIDLSSAHPHDHDCFLRPGFAEKLESELLSMDRQAGVADSSTESIVTKPELQYENTTLCTGRAAGPRTIGPEMAIRWEEDKGQWPGITAEHRNRRSGATSADTRRGPCADVFSIW